MFLNIVLIKAMRICLTRIDDVLLISNRTKVTRTDFFIHYFKCEGEIGC